MRQFPIGATVQDAQGRIGVIVPTSGRVPAGEVNVMRLNGSVQTFPESTLTVLFNPGPEHANKPPAE